MFREEDFTHINKMNNEMADGITDGSAAHKVLEELVDILSTIDFTSDEDRMLLMMKCINLCYEQQEDGEDILVEDKVFSTILALCFTYSNIMSNLIVDGFNAEDYFNFIKTEVLPVMEEESKALPYWDLDD
jgi:hypothetical protein